MEAIDSLAGDRTSETSTALVQPRRPTTRLVLEAATADHPLSDLVQEAYPHTRVVLILGPRTIAVLAQYLHHEGFDDHAGRIEAQLQRLKASLQRH